VRRAADGPRAGGGPRAVAGYQEPGSGRPSWNSHTSKK
jgi:hypothetical protein